MSKFKVGDRVRCYYIFVVYDGGNMERVEDGVVTGAVGKAVQIDNSDYWVHEKNVRKLVKKKKRKKRNIFKVGDKVKAANVFYDGNVITGVVKEIGCGWVHIKESTGGITLVHNSKCELIEDEKKATSAEIERNPMTGDIVLPVSSTINEGIGYGSGGSGMTREELERKHNLEKRIKELEESNYKVDILIKCLEENIIPIIKDRLEKLENKFKVIENITTAYGDRFHDLEKMSHVHGEYHMAAPNKIGEYICDIGKRLDELERRLENIGG